MTIKPTTSKLVDVKKLQSLRRVAQNCKKLFLNCDTFEELIEKGISNQDMEIYDSIKKDLTSLYPE